MQSAEWPRQRADVLTEFLPDGSGLVFDPRTELAYPLTASAAIIWETCDGLSTADVMAEKLAAVYDAPADVIARDVRALLEHLREIGLLEAAPAACG